MTQIILNVHIRSRNLRHDLGTVYKTDKVLILKNENRIITTSEHFFCPALSIKLVDGLQPTIITHSIPPNSFVSRNNTYIINLNKKEIPIPGKDFTIRPLSQDDTFSIYFWCEEQAFKILIARVLQIDHSY